MYMKPENIFAQIAEAGEEEQFDLLFKSPNCRIDRIVSSGHSSPKGFWYDQENDEFILLIQGEATLEFEDRKVTLKKETTCIFPKIANIGSIVPVSSRYVYGCACLISNREKVILSMLFCKMIAVLLKL